MPKSKTNEINFQGDKSRLDSDSRLIAEKTANSGRNMKALQNKITQASMSLAVAPKMAFSLGNLRERHRKLMRKVIGKKDPESFEYKNYSDTDSDLYDD